MDEVLEVPEGQVQIGPPEMLAKIGMLTMEVDYMRGELTRLSQENAELKAQLEPKAGQVNAKPGEERKNPATPQ